MCRCLLKLQTLQHGVQCFYFGKGPTEVCKFRIRMLEHYIGRAKALQQDEKALHDSMCAEIRPVMKSKRLLLFQEMMRDARVADESLFVDMCQGLKLVGDLDPSGQFPHQFKPASLDVEQLKQTAKWAQEAVVASCRKVADDAEIATAVWEETLEQALPEKQCVRGPFTAEEISSAKALTGSLRAVLGCVREGR